MKWADKILRYAKPLSVGLLLLFSFLLYTGTGLQIEPDFSALISDDGTYNTNERTLEQIYQENNGVILYYQPDPNTILNNAPTTTDTAAFQTHEETLRDALSQSQYVTRIGQTQRTPSNRTAAIPVSLYVPNEVNIFKEVKAELETYLDAVPPPPGYTVTVSGFPTILDRVSTLLISDNLRTTAFTAIIIFLVLYAYFLDARLAGIGMAAPLFSAVSLAALLTWLNIPITLTLAAVGVFVLGLGADYSIHFTIAYERFLEEGQTSIEAVNSVFEELTLPITASYLTTLAGFAALILGVSPSSNAQGVVLSLGITLIYAVSLTVIPILLVAFGSTYKPRPNPVFNTIQEGLANIARYQGEHPWRVLGVVAALTVVLATGFQFVYFSTSNSNWIPEDDPVSQSFRQYQYEYGQSDSVTIVLRAKDDDLRSPATIAEMQRLETRLSGIPNVDSVQSPFTDAPRTPTEGYRALTEQSAQFNEDYTVTTMTVRSQYFGVDESGEAAILQELRDALQRANPSTVTTSLFGDAVRFEELGQSLQQDTGITTGIGLVLVFVISSLLYTSLTVGFTALIPIVLAVVWAVGLMGFFGVPFTSLSTGLVSLVLGIGVDFSIHLVDSIKRAHRELNDIGESIYKALTTSGSAVLLSSITTLLGFLALSFSALLGTQRFGWSLALSILGVFAVCILLVPAITSLQLQKTQ